MIKLLSNIFLKTPKQETEILCFGKSKEISDKDSKAGISRFGGFMREPNYSQAYLKATKAVLDNALNTNELDELGLPIFYLARHTIELKIKELLELAYDTHDMNIKLYPNKHAAHISVSKQQRSKLGNSHNIEYLFNDLKKTCTALDINTPEKYFSPVIRLITEYETHSTWSRYSKSKLGSHVKNEVALPIVQLVQNLEELFGELSYNQPDNSDSLESELYSMLSCFDFEIERKKIPIE